MELGFFCCFLPALGFSSRRKDKCHQAKQDDGVDRVQHEETEPYRKGGMEQQGLDGKGLNGVKKERELKICNVFFCLFFFSIWDLFPFLSFALVIWDFFLHTLASLRVPRGA